MPGLTDVVALAAGNDHACAQSTTCGTVCWGHRGADQVGDDTQELDPVEVSAW